MMRAPGILWFADNMGYLASLPNLKLYQILIEEVIYCSDDFFRRDTAREFKANLLLMTPNTLLQDDVTEILESIVQMLNKLVKLELLISCGDSTSSHMMHHQYWCINALRQIQILRSKDVKLQHIFLSCHGVYLPSESQLPIHIDRRQLAIWSTVILSPQPWLLPSGYAHQVL